MFNRSRLIGLITIVVFAGAACGGDSGTGPSGLTFPPLADSLNALLCIRGNITAGQKKSGSVTATDCDQNAGAYWETWRVRVATARTVTMRVDAPQFDAVMGVLEITISGGDIVNASELASDDDTNGDDPQVVVDLKPDHDYLVVVFGYDYSAIGTYQLLID